MRRQSQCKKTKTENISQSPVVPLDLQIEILNRLPAKSTGRFLVVSKSWEKIIRSKSFISLFHFRSLTQPSRLLIVTSDQNSQTGHINYYLFSCSSSSSSSSSTSTSFISRITSHFQNQNPVNGEYKVLVFSWPDFQVFTLGAKPEESWRMIHCSVDHFPRSKGLCIDGAIYYIAHKGTGTTRHSGVVRFDLKSEKFDIFARLSDDINVWGRQVPTLINYYGKVATPIKISVTRIDLRVFEAGKQDFLEMSFDNLPEPCLHMKGINHLGDYFCTLQFYRDLCYPLRSQGS